MIPLQVTNTQTATSETCSFLDYAISAPTQSLFLPTDLGSKEKKKEGDSLPKPPLRDHSLVCKDIISLAVGFCAQ